MLVNEERERECVCVCVCVFCGGKTDSTFNSPSALGPFRLIDILQEEELLKIPVEASTFLRCVF